MLVYKLSVNGEKVRLACDNNRPDEVQKVVGVSDITVVFGGEGA